MKKFFVFAAIVAIVAAVAAMAVYVLKRLPKPATISEEFEVGDE